MKGLKEGFYTINSGPPIYMLCRLHLEDNLYDHCLSKTDRLTTQAIVKEVFGKEGLVHSTSRMKYEDDFLTFYGKYGDIIGEKTCSVLYYNLWNGVIEPSILFPEVKTQNNRVESAHAALKSLIQHQPLPLDKIVNVCENKHQAQNGDIERSVCTGGPSGPWELIDELKHFEVDYLEFRKWTPEQRQEYIVKVMKAYKKLKYLKDDTFSISKSGQFMTREKKLIAAKPHSSRGSRANRTSKKKRGTAVKETMAQRERSLSLKRSQSAGGRMELEGKGASKRRHKTFKGNFLVLFCLKYKL